MSKSKTVVNDAEIKHEGTEIILPVIAGKKMTYDEGITWLQRKKQEEEQKITPYHEIVCSPLDGLVAFNKAMKKQFGWTHLVTIPGSMFTSPQPPTMIGVETSTKEVVQAPLGRIQVPGIDGYLQTHLHAGKFVIAGEVKRKHEDIVKNLVKLTKEILKSDSIYKGKAIKINFDWKRREDVEADERYDPIKDAPRFMELDGISDDDLIFGEKVMSDINIGLFTPIEQAKACRKHGVPLKRGILLHGKYGTGKSLTAYVAALKATRNGFTFVYLDSVLDLKEGLEFAARYAPAVIFAEDIDRVIHGERSLGMDEILNTLDGVDTKNAEIITVFTTNHIDQINPAILRMGRLDTLVEITPPDAATAERLVKLYARGLLADDVDLNKVGIALEGKIPAFIREVTERAKIAAIYRLDGADIRGHVQEEDLLKAAKAMESHAAMLEPRAKEGNSNVEVFARIPAGNKNAKTLLQNLEKQSA